MKRKAIIIGEEPQKESKGIEFTSFLDAEGIWSDKFSYTPKDMKDIKSFTDTNGITIFLCTDESNSKLIYKGNLNDGTY
jgi:hypothetical protein